ncbi:hypothetical protein E2C01_077677 [Portunus trituberculatus]|uniref:Uncharacterized protein n=1 Tax=Portunus trituberculatus TaxID=210409 RepID=A0A5B7IQC3_PORTR|nr:hypothetical protein [Portunus trituberculatus]
MSRYTIQSVSINNYEKLLVSDVRQKVPKQARNESSRPPTCRTPTPTSHVPDVTQRFTFPLSSPGTVT